MCAIIIVISPRSTLVKRNRSISEMPVTMSGMVMGMLVSVIITLCGRFFML